MINIDIHNNNHKLKQQTEHLYQIFIVAVQLALDVGFDESFYTNFIFFKYSLHLIFILQNPMPCLLTKQHVEMCFY